MRRIARGLAGRVELGDERGGFRAERTTEGTTEGTAERTDAAGVIDDVRKNDATQNLTGAWRGTAGLP